MAGIADGSVSITMSAVALAVSSAFGSVVVTDTETGASTGTTQVVQIVCDGQSCRSTTDVTGSTAAVTDSLHRFLTDLTPAVGSMAPWIAARGVGLRMILMHF